MEFASKEEKVQYIFSRIANRYDVMNSVLSMRRHKAWRNYTMKKMNMKPGDTAIDVCTGTADWAIAMGEQAGPMGRIIGLDFCQDMLDNGIPKIVKKNLTEQVHLLNGNAMKLSFPDHSFDYATIGFALRNVPDITTVLEEMKRVVKPGGMVVSLELSKPTSAWFRKIYYFYFEKILPWIGALASRDEVSYSWLPESLRSFPDAQGLASIFTQVGLTDLQVKSFTGGIAAMHIGIKPSE